MKCPDRETVDHLDDLPNIGEATVRHLASISITHPQQLKGQDPYRLFDKLCKITGESYDPCLLDVFIAAVDYMNGAEAKPWWAYTRQRKQTPGY